MHEEKKVNGVNEGRRGGEGKGTRANDANKRWTTC